MVKAELGIQKEGGVGKYLGLPEHFGRRKRDLFTSIVDKIKQKGSSWSNRFFSKAGKMTMIKSVLSPIPSHSMQCFKLPVSLCKRIQSAVTRFWWDDTEGQHKMAWVSWDKMTQPKAIGGLGFRDFQAFNDAFLGKLSWRLHNNPELLMSRVLLGKYCHSESFMEVTEKSAVSHGWRGVLVGRDLLKENMGWVVGNGESIRLWDDPWLSLSSQQRLIGPATEATANLRVAELFQEGTRLWDEEKLQRVVPQWKDIIRAIKPSISGAPDKQIWLSTPTGDYSTKSGYHTAIERRTEETEPHGGNEDIEWFKGVWNLHTSPKIKMFLWKLFQQAIPTGEILVSRHIATEGLCKRCGASESIDHLFLHCPFARKIWSSAPFAVTVETSGLIDLISVWLSLCGRTCLPPTGIASGQLAPWIIWQIWCARNQFLFEGKSFSEEEVLTKAISQAREWINSQEKQPRAPQKQPPPLLPFTPNCTIVNSDAAWRASTQIAGLGWTIKTQGTSEEFTMANRCVNSVLTAEGLALREALVKCKELGISRLRCEADSA